MICNFRNFVLQNFPFIEDDFDALTDYELFCKMMEYVFKQVKDNEEFRKQLEEFQEEIDNLNIEGAVSDKLDEMASDGTLANLINQEIFQDLNQDIADVDNKVDILSDRIDGEIDNLVKFNNYTNKPLQYGKLTLPSEFNNIGFNLYRDNDNKIYDDLDLSRYETNNKVYVDYDNGDDTTHPDGVFKTIKGALTYINTLAGNYYKIICKTYRFARNEFWNEQQTNEEYTMQKSVIIEPEDMTKRILVSTDQRNLTWANQGGGVWLTSRGGVSGVFNLQKTDGTGMYEKFTKVNSLEDCQATSKTWYLSGSNLYVHSNEEPTFDKYIIRLTLPIVTFNIHNNRFLRLKNIDFYPSRRIMFQNNSSDYENALICENVRIFSCNDWNGFSTDNVKKIFILNCVTGDNLRDGFNYHFPDTPLSVMESSLIYEVNCKSFNNGLDDVNDTNNCSTVHEHARIIRCNNVYQNSKTRCIADIGSPRVLMINCDINQTIQNYRGLSFQDEVAGSGEGIAYLIDCKCLIKRTENIDGTDNFRVRLKNFKGNYINNSLNIELYEE